MLGQRFIVDGLNTQELTRRLLMAANNHLLSRLARKGWLLSALLLSASAGIASLANPLVVDIEQPLARFIMPSERLTEYLFEGVEQKTMWA